MKMKEKYKQSELYRILSITSYEAERNFQLPIIIFKYLNNYAKDKITNFFVIENDLTRPLSYKKVIKETIAKTILKKDCKYSEHRGFLAQ